MNKTPMNYLLTAALGGILWVVTAIFFGSTFSESLMLAVSPQEDFLANFRVMLGIAAAIGIINCLYWYYYGTLDSTAGDLRKARRLWWTFFILQVVASVGLLFILVFRNLNEGIPTKDWLIIYALLSLHTWFFFWLCTYLMSPRTVQYIPLFK